MTKDSSDKGIVLLVTDATETYSAKKARLEEEYGGLGDNGVYKVGYYYNRNGKQGIVFEVSADGRSGKIISIVCTKECNWYYAREWCANLGQGWRLPTKRELLIVSNIRENTIFKEAVRRYIPRGSQGYIFAAVWGSDEYTDHLGNDCATLVAVYDGTARDDTHKGSPLFTAYAVSDF